MKARIPTQKVLLTLERILPKISPFEVKRVRVGDALETIRARLRTGGIKTPTGDIQTTFGLKPEVIEKDVLTRQLGREIPKGGKRPPEPTARFAVGADDRLLLFKESVKEDTALLKEFEKGLKNLGEFPEVREVLKQETLFPKKIDRVFRTLPDEAKIKPIPEKPPKPFKGEPADTLDVGAIARQQQILEQRAKLTELLPPEQPSAIEPPRNIFEELREFRRARVPEPRVRAEIGVGLGQLDIQLAGEVSDVETRQRQEVRPTIDVATSQLLETDLEQLGKQGTKPFVDVTPEFDIAITPDIITTPEQDLELVPPLKVPTTQPPPEEIIEVPPEKPIEEPSLFVVGMGLDPLRERPKRTFKGFDAFARERGRKVKLNKVPLTERAAEDLATEVVDKTISARGSVKEIKKPLKKPPKDGGTGFSVLNRFKFREFNINRKGERTNNLPEGNFIEKRRFRLDTPSEVKEISVARFLKQKSKSALNLGGFNNIGRNRLL